MAKVTPGALIADIRGKLGPVVFRGSEIGLQVYQNPRKKNYESESISTNRRIVSVLRFLWQNLSSEDRESWNQLSLAVRTNRGFNGQYPRRAYSLFHSINYWLVRLDAPTVSTAPTWPLQSSIVSANAGLFTTGLDLYWNSNGGGFDYWITAFEFRQCLCINQLSKFTPWRLLDVKMNSTGTDVPSVEYPKYFINPELGQEWQIRFIGVQRGYFPIVETKPIYKVAS